MHTDTKNFDQAAIIWDPASENLFVRYYGVTEGDGRYVDEDYAIDHQYHVEALAAFVRHGGDIIGKTADGVDHYGVPLDSLADLNDWARANIV